MTQPPPTQTPPDQIDYVDLITGLSESDSERRKQAEEIYNSIPAKDRFSLLGGALCRKEIGLPIRAFAAVLLRRLILNSWSEIQGSVPPQQLLLSCNQLLELLKNSSDEAETLREKMCYVVAAVGKSFVNETTQLNDWHEFVQFMFELFRSHDMGQRQIGFTIFTSNPEAFGQVNGQTAFIEQIHQCFMESFGLKSNHESFCSSLVGATAALIISNSANKECIKKLSSMSVPLAEILREPLRDSTKEEILQHLIEVAEEAPFSLRPAVAQIMQSCIDIMVENSELDSEVQFSALELVCSLIENAPVMVKKRAAAYIKPVVLRILTFMSSIEDDPDWYTSCTNDKDEEEPDAIGESSLDRISNALGGKVLLPILIDELTSMLQRPEWQVRHAALVAFACAGEGCRDQLMKVLDKIVNGILSFLGDPHPRVRHAACNAIGQMATDFAPDFENKFHDQVIPPLCRLLVDCSNIRVQAHSACAMINFFEECPQDIMTKYLGPITEHIESALSTYMREGLPEDEGKLFVIENIVVVLSSVADTSSDSFVEYYGKFMPCLKFIIKNSTGRDELRLLRGKAIECVSLIGLAVGKVIFCNDASDIMQMLLATQTGDLKLADDDPQLSYMMAAWARICRILGPDFQSYLPYVMEPVLKAAALKVEIALLNDDDRALIENNSDWESVSVHDQAVGIRTAGLEDKATACSMLVCYARELKHGFVDYVERTAEVLVPLLKFPFQDDVRSAAAEAMPYLLESARPKGEECILLLWHAIFENLIGAIEIETDPAVLNQLMMCMACCIETVGQSSMTPERYEKLTAKLLERFKVHFETMAEEYEKRKDEDYEAESECSDDEDRDCLSGIAMVTHSLFVAYKNNYLPYFQPIIEPLLKISTNDQSIPWSNRQTALCIWDDVIEYTGHSCLDYKDIFLPLLTSGIVDNSKQVRQAAFYGIGQLAEHNGLAFLEYIQSVIPTIVQIVNHPESRSDDHILATENGIAAIGRILRHCPQISSYHELLKCWLDWLPIWEDEDEVLFVVDYLMDLIDQNNPTVIGPNSSNVPRLVAIVAEFFERSVIKASTPSGARCVKFVQQVHSNPTLNVCFGSLTEAQKKALDEAVS